MPHDEDVRPSFLSRIVALLVLAVVAWLLLKVVIGAIAAVAWFVAVVVAIIGVIWAISVLRR
jgi:membrane associated rhomboid family serine protease